MRPASFKKAALPPTPIRRRKTSIDFRDHKAQAAPLQHAAPKKAGKLASLKHEHEDLFDAFSPQLRSTGANIGIIRTWMHKVGLPEIPERFKVQEFASAMQWHITERHAWRHFGQAEIREAREFLESWATAVLPHVSSAGV